MSQHALIDLCKGEAQKHLVQGHYDLAIPGALQALRFAMKVYGAGNIELVPCYLLLAESNLGLKRYNLAEEFLLYANWNILKNPDCGHSVRSQLHRNFGKLYASQKRYDEALEQLAKDVYYSSLQNGPEHLETSSGYFYMANVFLLQQHVQNCLAFYDKVVDIWYKFLTKLSSNINEDIFEYLSEAHIDEAFEMLNTIFDARTKCLGAEHIATGEVAYTLAMLNRATAKFGRARELYNTALIVYNKHLGEEHEYTQAILSALEDIPVISAEEQHQSGDTQDSKSSKAEQETEAVAPMPEATDIIDAQADESSTNAAVAAPSESVSPSNVESEVQPSPAIAV
jgi:hypothetical protein